MARNKTVGEKSSSSSEHDHDETLQTFTKMVLNNESTQRSDSSGDSVILSSPEKDLRQSQSCTDDQDEDQFEGIFYTTCITSCMTKLRCISLAFFHVFS